MQENMMFTPVNCCGNASNSGENKSYEKKIDVMFNFSVFQKKDT